MHSQKKGTDRCEGDIYVSQTIYSQLTRRYMEASITSTRLNGVDIVYSRIGEGSAK